MCTNILSQKTLPVTRFYVVISLPATQISVPVPPLNWLNTHLYLLNLTALFIDKWKMDESKAIDSKESGEYEDDFEKDLEWLINDKEKSNGGIIEVCVNRQ